MGTSEQFDEAVALYRVLLKISSPPASLMPLGVAACAVGFRALDMPVLSIIAAVIAVIHVVVVAAAWRRSRGVSRYLQQEFPGRWEEAKAKAAAEDGHG